MIRDIDRFLGQQCFPPPQYRTIFFGISQMIVIGAGAIGFVAWLLGWIFDGMPAVVTIIGVVGMLLAAAVMLIVMLSRLYRLLFMICLASGFGCSFVAVTGYHPILFALGFVCLEALAVFFMFRADHWEKSELPRRHAYDLPDE